jgi:hypothetical protein
VTRQDLMQTPFGHLDTNILILVGLLALLLILLSLGWLLAGKARRRPRHSTRPVSHRRSEQK